MDHRQNLRMLVGAYSAKTGRGPARVGTLAASSGSFFKRIESGGSLTVDTYTKVLHWFSDNWPADLDWPVDVARPAPSSTSSAA
jgi:hypothetical protein